MERRHIKWVPLLLVGLFLAYQYFSSEKFVNPETGRKSHVGMSTQQEALLGLQSYQQVLTQSETVDSGPELDMVKRVASRLATATGKGGADFDWQVSLIRSPEVNAFCLPGGKIVVYTGILPVAQNEAALATVLGHEMAHATSRHGSQRVLEQNLAQTALTGVAMSLSDMDYDKQRAVMGALGAGAQFGVLMPFSRKHESEADAIGLLYMARAGYDPQESIRFWQRMESTGTSQPPEFLSSHPSHGTRIQQLEAEMPKALEEYNRSSHAGTDSSP
jgi:metalloendopeptidase OMA1, mitochondrial